MCDLNARAHTHLPRQKIHLIARFVQKISTKIQISSRMSQKQKFHNVTICLSVGCTSAYKGKYSTIVSSPPRARTLGWMTPLRLDDPPASSGEGWDDDDEEVHG